MRCSATTRSSTAITATPPRPEARGTDALTALGADPVAAGELIDELAARYAEPRRRYHTLDHVAAVLGTIDDLSPELSGRDRWLVETAVWFHDAVYNPTAVDNEDRSAVLAEERLAAAGADPAATADVARLVRLTAHHRAPEGDGAATALLDADLAVLGAEPALYDAYRRAIRQEYSHLSDTEFAAGRRQVLQALLDAPVLFGGTRARQILEPRARVNLAREISLLDDPG